ncbi:YecA/YgfB family protein [Pseudogulbenkiania ferrooxidans]|uniref:YecA family protein n=1 Tax=Pseudogulbenkiania ferrooxidans 2002 TaxID=279714 RepID=B9Z7D7_9NEIS|nr:YecA family protein [Pseudogulbenkiania ferrooxidans]EEG07452.1 yecA family protein [Pseudogulbenkiania ferrooxidans 2002]
MSHKPLTDRDYQNLATTLARFRAQHCMGLEQLDGFFAALLCGPEPIKPSEVLPLILGDAFDDETAFSSQKALEQFVSLLMGHWLDIADTLHSGREFHPWLEPDEHGVVHGNDWAQGFTAGMELMNEDWGLLFEDEEQAEALVPIMALAFEHHPDPEMRPYVDNADAGQREQWLAGISPAVEAIYRFFAAMRRQMEQESAAAEQAETAKPAAQTPRPVRPGKKSKDGGRR